MLRPVICATLLGLSACTGYGDYRDTSIPMESVAQLDTDQYLGLWYEIARFPNFFEEGCVGVTAEYALREDGRINVLNSCREGALDGPLEQAEGVARVVAPGELKVKFVEWLPFEGDYWVIGLTEDYTMSVVGEPDGDYGWILAREPVLEEGERAEALAVLQRFGYDTAQLIWTEQLE
ncbi:MAG: lipocalin family protein [Pseudomonadota bacterium]